MYHSITFGTKNTWDDWHLIPASRPVVPPPTVRTSIVEIPGANGSIDLTNAIAGKPLFENRTGSFTFYVENGFKPWYDLYAEICAYLHGQRTRVVLEDDPGFYYEGRISVNTWRSDAQRSSITIDFVLDPLKIDIYSSSDKWLWDPFSFITGVIRDYTDIIINGEYEVTVLGNTDGPVVPAIICTEAMTVTYLEDEYELVKGENIVPEIIIYPGDNYLTFTGNGHVTIRLGGGVL